MKKILLWILAYVCCGLSVRAQASHASRFKALVLYENGGHHVDYSKTARIWLDKLAVDSNFTVDYLSSTDKITDDYLAGYRLIIQLDYAPYGWKPEAAKALERYIEKGRGGWIGFHHATLLGRFDGYPLWQWFSKFMGGIEFKNYIATFADGQVQVGDRNHPVMKGVDPAFMVKQEEWYTYNQSPRPNVHVIASVNENSYQPNTNIKMGDHPVIWTNPHYRARNIYIFMGHSPTLFDNENYRKIFSNAIFWAAINRID